MTYAIMGLVLLFMAFILIYKAKLTKDTSHFFNLTNTTAMRGFWCIIVILVHIPAVYQNRIQDLMGSFAYIGVTFFFMTSAYGLKVGAKKNPDSTKVMHLIECKDISPLDLLSVNMWVVWLLACYAIYWAVNIFVDMEGYQDLLICLLIAAGSITVYCLKDRMTVTTWCPEVFGFIWGILLADYREWFVRTIKRKWLLISLVLCLLSGILGLSYLRFKSVLILGDYLLKIMLGLAIILFILALNVSIALGNKVSLFLGRISYEVYLIHGAVFGLMATFMPGINSGLFISLSIVITVALSWVVNLMSRPVIKKVNSLLVSN